MDTKKSIARCGHGDHPLASSMGDAKSYVTDEDGSIGMELREEKSKAEEEKVVITGKKKGKKPMQDKDKDDLAESFSEEIDFSGENKLKSKNGRFVSFALLDIEDYKAEAVDASCVELGDESMIGREITEETNTVTKSEEVVETSKSKKKKKNKSVRTAHEEDDLDKILAELGKRERGAEVIRQRRKMRDKEKLQKKKQDGELLTASKRGMWLSRTRC